ncbi:MAG: FAD-dependent oxidoreductase [Chloroflexi bacterium]|nr:FAD-dependent oxidoreductase [Chloroflexota bacterium]
MDNDGIRMYGTTWCIDCKRAKKFFGEHRVRYQFIDVEEDQGGLRIVEKVNRGKRIVPTILFPDGSVMVEPSNADLAAKLGLQTSPSCPYYDLIIIGGGPAALTAALYTAREKIETLVVERSALGGQAGVTERIDNYPGFPEGVTGAEFAERLVQQCRQFGVEMLSATEVTAMGLDGEDCWVGFANGQRASCRAILLAPGSKYRRLGVPGEEDFIGAGVHFCATCDGPFYKDQEVLVVGGGNSAVEEAVFLTKFARKVNIAYRGTQLTASAVAREKALASPKIAVHYETVVAEFRGKARLSSVVIRNVRTGETNEVACSGVFVFIGLEPNTKWLKGSVELDDMGFIVTDSSFRTNMPNVFAAGDARKGSTKQLVSAAGEGAASALMIRHFLQSAKVLPSSRND